MACPDPKVHRYLPTTPSSQVLKFEKGVATFSPTDSHIVKIDDSGCISNKNEAWKFDATDIILGYPPHPPPTSVAPYDGTSGTQFVLVRGLVLLLKLGLRTPKAMVCILTTSNRPKTRMTVTASKMEECTSLFQIQSGDCTKQLLLDFSPGAFLPKKHPDKKNLFSTEMLWFANVDINQLKPLPWWENANKFYVLSCEMERERERAKGNRGGTIQINWIEGKSVPPPLPITKLKWQLGHDFKIKCSDGEEVPCHRSVLVEASEALKQVFEDMGPAAGLDFGKLFDADSKTTEVFLKCLYFDLKDVRGLEASFSVTTTVLNIAEAYQIPELKEKCVDIIMAEEDPEWFDIGGLYSLYKFVRLLTDSQDLMVELNKKILGISARLITKQKSAGLMEGEDDDLDNLLRFERDEDRKVFKEWMKGAFRELAANISASSSAA